MIDQQKIKELRGLLEKYKKLGYYKDYLLEFIGRGYSDVLLYDPDFNINNIMELLDFFKKNGFYLWSITPKYVKFTDDTRD